MRVADATAVQASRTDPQNERYNGWRPATAGEVQAHARQQDPKTIGVAMGVVQLVIEVDEVFVGDLGVQTLGDHDRGEPGATIELGVVLVPHAKKQGIATRAIRLLLPALFAKNVHRIVARVDPRNTASLRLFERLDFRREGTQRSCYWDEKYREWTDEALFAILGSEWPAMQPPK